ncbi:MAG: caspase family protein [Saprospiraceae bacterium]|nr:caspase family protein [Saprospiraceae bacterium]
MKNLLTIFALLAGTALAAQTEKGASPLNPQSAIANPQSVRAVVVGISDYQDPAIPDLRFADRDAEAFANFLRSPAGGSLDGDQLKLLTDSAATTAQFDAALGWLMDESKEGDQAIIYFSGHGDVETKTRSQQGFLLCWDSPPQAYVSGAYPIFFLKEVVSTLSMENKARVIIITDACRSGKLAGNSIGGSQLTSQNLAQQFANEIKILSCQPNEYSIEGEQWGGGRGAFSFHLVDGLYGMADGNADASVNLMEIGRYLDDHVTTEVAPQSQVPMTVGNRTEKLATVFPDMLAQVKKNKAGQLPIFSSTDSRGIEEDVLATVDTTIREFYKLFKQALKDKVFLEPAGACADAFYERLIAEPKMERLHNAMRRNYAAALQDDAQQALNNLMKMEKPRCDSTALSASKICALSPTT